ncbi:MAG: hypothetical protein ABSE58_07660 [Candidatus Limnocylindrales bacterium]
MSEERSWRVESRWWLSSFAALMAVLLVFRALATVYSFVFTSASQRTLAGVSDQYSAAIGIELFWPVAVLLVFYPFLAAAAVGFRLLVPTFAGAPPRAVAAVVTTWPVALGGFLISSDMGIAIFFAAVGLAWALTMPLPKETLLTVDPVRGGAILGLAFGAFAIWDGMLVAIIWCAWRLYRNNSAEVAATALCAAIVPGLLILNELPTSSTDVQALYLVAEVLILACLALAGFVLSRRPRIDARSPDESEDQARRIDETAEA